MAMDEKRLNRVSGSKVSQIANIFQQATPQGPTIPPAPCKEAPMATAEVLEPTTVTVMRTESHLTRFNTARALFEKLGAEHHKEPPITPQVGVARGRSSTPLQNTRSAPNIPALRSASKSPPPIGNHAPQTNGHHQLDNRLAEIEKEIPVYAVPIRKADKPEKPEKPERKFNSRELIEKQRNWTSHFSRQPRAARAVSDPAGQRIVNGQRPSSPPPPEPPIRTDSRRSLQPQTLVETPEKSLNDTHRSQSIEDDITSKSKSSHHQIKTDQKQLESHKITENLKSDSRRSQSVEDDRKSTHSQLKSDHTQNSSTENVKSDSKRSSIEEDKKITDSQLKIDQKSQDLPKNVDSRRTEDVQSKNKIDYTQNAIKTTEITKRLQFSDDVPTKSIQYQQNQSQNVCEVFKNDTRRSYTPEEDPPKSKSTQVPSKSEQKQSDSHNFSKRSQHEEESKPKDHKIEQITSQNTPKSDSGRSESDKKSDLNDFKHLESDVKLNQGNLRTETKRSQSVCEPQVSPRSPQTTSLTSSLSSPSLGSPTSVTVPTYSNRRTEQEKQEHEDNEKETIENLDTSFEDSLLGMLFFISSSCK